MAIIVVEEKPDQSVVKNVICRNCGVKLEYTPNDIKNRSYTDISGTRDVYYWIDCPRCDSVVDV